VTTATPTRAMYVMHWCPASGRAVLLAAEGATCPWCAYAVCSVPEVLDLHWRETMSILEMTRMALRRDIRKSDPTDPRGWGHGELVREVERVRRDCIVVDTTKKAERTAFRFAVECGLHELAGPGSGSYEPILLSWKERVHAAYDSPIIDSGTR
jgi:hypothetical protein